MLQTTSEPYEIPQEVDNAVTLWCGLAKFPDIQKQQNR